MWNKYTNYVILIMRFPFRDILISYVTEIIENLITVLLCCLFESDQVIIHCARIISCSLLSMGIYGKLHNARTDFKQTTISISKLFTRLCTTTIVYLFMKK